MQQSEIDAVILSVTFASEITGREEVQSLWSGYGSIVRVRLQGGAYPSVIVKHVQPDAGGHPRGWNTDLSHQRKLTSYQVEARWYRDARGGTPVMGGMDYPECYGVKADGSEVLLVLEDLDAKGFAGRRGAVNEVEWKACVKWLAIFHAANMGQSSEGLWETGTYWHLETRPDELEALDDLPLKQAAAAIDAKLKASPFQTVVHGDAKLANFCFSDDGAEVAAVDFQYVGGGVGMKDLAYFVGSCFRDAEAERREAEILDVYFSSLETELVLQGGTVKTEEVIADWRSLYRVAWADFHRFMKGWSPGHWKLSDYSERVTREVIAQLEKDAV